LRGLADGRARVLSDPAGAGPALQRQPVVQARRNADVDEVRVTVVVSVIVDGLDHVVELSYDAGRGADVVERTNGVAAAAGESRIGRSGQAELVVTGRRRQNIVGHVHEVLPPAAVVAGFDGYTRYH